MKWVKVYFNQDQYDEWRRGNCAIGYEETDVEVLRSLEREGVNCGLKTDPLNHMTKVDPRCLEELTWSTFGVYVMAGRP